MQQVEYTTIKRHVHIIPTNKDPYEWLREWYGPQFFDSKPEIIKVTECKCETCGGSDSLTWDQFICSYCNSR
jgi:hypothetical protein